MKFSVKLSIVLGGLVLILRVGVDGSYPFFGKCLNHSVLPEINATRYAGLWYEVDKYFSFSEFSQSCVTYRYRDQDRGGRSKGGVEYLSFVKKGINKRKRQTSIQSGRVVFSSPKKSGRMEATVFDTKFGKHERIKGNKGRKEAYWILGTDYDSYSVIWSCEHAGIINFQNVRLLTREKDPSIFTRGRAYGVMQRHGLVTKLLVSTDQENCPPLFREDISNKTRQIGDKIGE